MPGCGVKRCHYNVQQSAQAAHTLTHPSRTVTWVSAFGLSNNNKWRWWMWMVATTYQQTHSPRRLAWSEDWLPPGAQSAVIKWTRWTLSQLFSYYRQHCAQRKAPVYNLLIGRFIGFSSHRATCCTNGEKFAWRSGPCQISPPSMQQ